MTPHPRGAAATATAEGSIVVLVSFRALPGRAAEVRDVLGPVVEQIHSEVGCELYALHEAEDGHFVLVEKWASKGDADRHGLSSPVQPILAEKLTPLVEGPPEITELRPLPLGPATKGAL